MTWEPTLLELLVPLLQLISNLGVVFLQTIPIGQPSLQGVSFYSLWALGGLVAHQSDYFFQFPYEVSL